MDQTHRGVRDGTGVVEVHEVYVRWLVGVVQTHRGEVRDAIGAAQICEGHRSRLMGADQIHDRCPHYLQSHLTKNHCLPICFCQ